MATLILPYPAFTAGTPAVAAEVQDNFTTIRDHINGQNIGTANIETTLVSRVGGPILFLNQASQEQIALSILNSRTKSALQITQSAVLGAGSSIIAIDDNATQTTGDAQLYINTQLGSTIPAIKVNHGSDVTMSLTKTQLELFNSAVEVSAARIKLPVLTTAEKTAVTQEGSVVYDTSKKELSFRTDTTWIPASTPTGCVQMFAGSVAPQGWLLCDGGEYLKTAYPELNAILSVGATYPYGETDGSGGIGTTHFRTPDCRGIFVRGAGSQTISGETYSATLGAREQDATAINGLSLTDPGHFHSITVYDDFNSPAGSNVAGHNNSAVSNTGATQSKTTGITLLGDTETRPANIAFNYIIKT